ncbi:MAG TPA: hypothetical protein VFX97_20705 [Pyrinomonadaceae bacterium]|nr:hypothetical protein [Pyrinomonadaceae bacterium]
MDDIEAVELNGPTKQEKPRGKCTGCAFSYQLGTARTGEHKGKPVIRKHNSRTGPGLCSGAQQPPEVEHTTGCTEEQRFGPSVCAGCDDCLSCQGDPDHCEEHAATGYNGLVPSDVVGVAPGGTPIVADPWTAPLAVAEGDVSDNITRGPWVLAAFDGECDGTCGGSILEGGEIRANGEGGWLCGDCGADEPLPHDHGPLPYSLSDAVAAAPLHEPLPHDQWTPTGTVLDRMTPEQRVEALGVSQVAYGAQTAALPLPFTAPAAASDIPESTTTVSGQPEPVRDRWGRYLIMGTAHTRATTFAKLGANTKAIEAWNERNVIRGLTLRPDLLMLANGLEVKRDRNDLNSIAAQAKDAAGSKVAANIGTAYHAFSERIDAGLMSLADVPTEYRHRVDQYLCRINGAGLRTRPEWIERTTAVRADQVGAPLPVAGTLDRIFQLPDGSLVIGDLKTGSDLSYGEMEIEVQLALYAHGVNTHGLFDWNTKTWEPLRHFDFLPGSVKVRTDIAIVVHLPADGDGCTLYVADIERGWRDAQRLGPLQASLKEKKRFRTLMMADLHGPVSAPGPTTEPLPYPAPLTADDAWGLAKELISTAQDQLAVSTIYQFAMDSGKFHQDQLAVLVGLGKDRLNALARA